MGGVGGVQGAARDAATVAGDLVGAVGGAGAVAWRAAGGPQQAVGGPRAPWRHPPPHPARGVPSTGPPRGRLPRRAGPGAYPGGERRAARLGRDIGDLAVHRAAHQDGVLRRSDPARGRTGLGRPLQSAIRRGQRRQVRRATRPVPRRDGLPHSHQGDEDCTERRRGGDRPDRRRALVTAPSPPQEPPPPRRPAPSAPPLRAAVPRPVRAPDRPPAPP